MDDDRIAYRPPLAASDEVRLMARVARLYHDDGMRQTEIATRLGLSQARVSRLLKRAVATGIVRVTVVPVPGLNSDVELKLQDGFGLRTAIVVDGDDETVLRGLGAAAAYHLETSLRSGQLIGVSSRSASLLASVELMRTVTTLRGVRVVQILGGLGDPSVTEHASRLTEQLASRTKGEAVFLPAPAVAGSAASAAALRQDPFVEQTMRMYDRLDVAVVGLGAMTPPAMVMRRVNAISSAELEDLERLGAVGDVCLRFFDRAGQPVRSSLSDRIIGIGLDQLRATPHCVCVAAGSHKVTAICGALRAGFIDVLVTDKATAEQLLDRR